MQRLFKFGLVALSVLFSMSVFSANIAIGSWNVKRLGHGDQQSFEALGAVASQFDIVALQEVMSEKGLDRMQAAIERASGEKWGRLESHLIGSFRYKEMYAFLYRKSSVEYDEGAVVFMDRGDRFQREPFSAKFRARSDHTVFAIGTVHILYGKGVDDRTPEIRALAEYWHWLGDIYPGVERILAGDFNLPPDHPAWAPLKQYAKPLITRGASTLSGKDGRFANLYDNLWIDRNSRLAISSFGIFNYPHMLNWSHEKSRKHVSDHAPVYLTLGRGHLNSGVVQALSRPTIGAVFPIGQVTARAQPASLKKPILYAAASSGIVRGNRNSKIYHRTDCPSFNKIMPENQVEFESASAAQTAGYRLAGNCR